MQFSTIYGDVCTAIGDLQQARLAEVKSMINMIYLGEVLNCDLQRPMYWLRFLNDSIKTKTADTVAGVTKANPGVLTTAADTFTTGDIVSLYALGGMVELNNRAVKLTRTSAKTYTMTTLDGTAIDTTNYTTYTSGGTVNHRGATLSKAVRSIISVNWHGYVEPLTPITAKELETQTSYWDVTASQPKYYQHVKTFSATGTEVDMILWFLLPDTNYQMRIWFEYSPGELSATTDYPILPPQFHPALTSGAIARLGENKVQLEAGQVWPALYKMQLEALISYNRKLWSEYETQRSKPYLQ
jgi:hypothetical protein